MHKKLQVALYFHNMRDANQLANMIAKKGILSSKMDMELNWKDMHEGEPESDH
jgi:hypothetical protein